MLKHRVIPCLLIRGGGLVKTHGFSKSRYIGDPINAIRIFNDKEVDEILVLDIDASAAGREPDFERIAQYAGECFMPLCYGGGVRSVEQAQRLFALGVEKISVQSGALADLSLVSAIATRFGNQSVVVSVDVKKSLFGGYKLYSAALRRTVNGDWLKFITDSVNAGAGEILINSVERDGSLVGMDLPLISQAAAACSVPLIALGGVGSLADIKAAVDAGASAVAAGAFFVYHGPHRAVLITYPKYDDLRKLLG